MEKGIELLKERIANRIADENDIILREKEPLSSHTTFKIGGAAELFASPLTVDAVKWLITASREAEVRSFVLGRGSNVLFSDSGFNGIILSTDRMREVSEKDGVITAQCGATLNSCALLAKERGLSGLECLYSIPGSVGGAVFMNAGAYGGEMKDIVLETTYLDTDKMTVKTIRGSEHQFGYRKSVFCQNGGIILETKLKLTPSDTEAVSEAMEDYRGRRVAKQPLEYPSAGSTFKRYPGRYTGQMIEQAGLKGFAVGGAQVSEKHAGFVINRGGATAADVLAIIDIIKKKIYELHGIEIETEVIYVE